MSGRVAIKKGVRFEEKVAELYRMLGADVKTNIMICEKKVDILATFGIPGSPIGHRIIVECKDEEHPPAQNQRVIQLQGLVSIARKSGDADSGEIITKVRWGDAAQGFARQADISLLTYREKVARLINFSPYMRDLITTFETENLERPGEPPLGAYYIDGSATSGSGNKAKQIAAVGGFLGKWAKGSQLSRHLVVFGEYGTGKTSLSLKVAHDLAKSYLKAQGSVRIPVLINLREYTKSLKIDSLITSFLDEYCGVPNPKFKLFKAMNDEGMFLVILDGFDEMAVKVDRDTLEANLLEIEKLTIARKSRVLLTSRSEYFVTGEEEEKALNPRGNILQTRRTQYESITLSPWSKAQIDSFIQKRVPLISEAKQKWMYYRDQIGKIPGLSDLSKRPVLLEMIVKSLPQLVASSNPINRPGLYETYLRSEIKRQKISKHRTLLLSEASRFSMMQRLASHFYVNASGGISFTDAQHLVENNVDLPKGESEAYTRDFLACSFLIRRRDQFEFSHRSIWEYLVAKTLATEVMEDKPKVFGIRPLERVITGFLGEILQRGDLTLFKWIDSSRGELKADMGFLGGNAATVLVEINKNSLAGKDLRHAVLSGADLSSANLDETVLDNAIMKDVKLTSAKFTESQMKQAKLSNVTVTVHIMGTLGPRAFHLGEAIERLQKHFFSCVPCQIQSMTIGMSGTDYAGTVDIQVSDFQQLQRAATGLSRPPLVLTEAIYSHELEAFHEKRSNLMKGGPSQGFNIEFTNPIPRFLITVNALKGS